jgi:hypothetical protein
MLGKWHPSPSCSNLLNISNERNWTQTQNPVLINFVLFPWHMGLFQSKGRWERCHRCLKGGEVDTLKVFIDTNEARLVPGSVQFYCRLVNGSTDDLYTHCWQHLSRMVRKPTTSLPTKIKYIGDKQKMIIYEDNFFNIHKAKKMYQ